MQQRAQIPHRRPKPSSATQLPIVAALNAENLTLLHPILHETAGNVNTQFDIFLPIDGLVFIAALKKPFAGAVGDAGPYDCENEPLDKLKFGWVLNGGKNRYKNMENICLFGIDMIHLFCIGLSIYGK